MKPEVAKRWSDALRSGRYKQGREHLKKTDDNGDSYCCLGVLCEVYREDYPEFQWYNRGLQIGNASGTSSFRGHSSVPPDAVLTWAGMRNCAGEFGDKPATHAMYEAGSKTNLMAVNDKLLYGFDQIADLIEANYEQM